MNLFAIPHSVCVCVCVCKDVVHRLCAIFEDILNLVLFSFTLKQKIKLIF